MKKGSWLLALPGKRKKGGFLPDEYMPDEDTWRKIRFGRIDGEVLELKFHLSPARKYCYVFLIVALAALLAPFAACIPGVLIRHDWSGDVVNSFSLVFAGTILLFLECVLLYQLLFLLFRADRQLLRFQRRAGLVDLPAPGIRGWRGETRSIPFGDIHIRLRRGYRGGGETWVIGVRGQLRAFRLFGSRQRRELGFLVWYMEPGCPLPPGRILDPYRTQDRETRGEE